MDSVKAMGGRPMVTEIQSLKQAMAGPEIAGAAAAIIAQARGILKWQNDHDNAMTDWADQNPGQYNTAKFEKQFIKDHDIKKYITDAKHGFAYQGQAIPAAGEREKGQAYMTPKGPRVWTGTGWAPSRPRRSDMAQAAAAPAESSDEDVGITSQAAPAQQTQPPPAQGEEGRQITVRPRAQPKAESQTRTLVSRLPVLDRGASGKQSGRVFWVAFLTPGS